MRTRSVRENTGRTLRETPKAFVNSKPMHTGGLRRRRSQIPAQGCFNPGKHHAGEPTPKAFANCSRGLFQPWEQYRGGLRRRRSQIPARGCFNPGVASTWGKHHAGEPTRRRSQIPAQGCFNPGGSIMRANLRRRRLRIPAQGCFNPGKHHAGEPTPKAFANCSPRVVSTLGNNNPE
jgi:hypothetical protein